MMTKSWILPLVLGASLSSIYFLPNVGTVAQSAVIMELPETFGSWVLRTQPPSEAEISALADDTRFSKAMCLNARPGEFNEYGNPVPDIVQLSIVLSGADINNSIHRPERCMPAQGHNITSSSDQILKLPNGRQFPVKRLSSIQSVRDGADTEREKYLKYNCVTYYFFVGHDQITNAHLSRTLIDIKDRLVRGMDQRWAYVSMSMWYGKVPYSEHEVTESEADAKIMKFLEGIAEKQIQWNQITL